MASVESIADIGVKLHILKGKTDTAPIKGAGKELDILAQRQRTASFAAMNFNRIIQDSPYFLTSFNMGLMSIANNVAPFAESLAAAKKEGVGMQAMLKGMFTGIGGWLTVINLAVAGVQMLTMWMRQNKEETDGAKIAAEEYLSILKDVARYKNQNEFQVVFTEETAKKAISEVKGKLAKAKKELEGITSMTSAWSSDQLIVAEVSEAIGVETAFTAVLQAQEKLKISKQAEIDALQAQNDFLEKSVKTEQLRENMRKELLALGGEEIKQNENSKSIAEDGLTKEQRKTEELGNQLALRKKLLIEQVKANQFSVFGSNEAVTERDLKREAARMQAKRRKIGVLGAETALESPKKPAEQGSEEGLDYGTAFTGAFSSTFTQGMTSAWTKIFGEANSIGEMFIQSFVGNLVSQLSGRLATSLLADVGGGDGGGGIFGVFGSILGGIGSLFGLDSRGNEGRPVMAGTSTNVVLNVDGKKLMQVAVEPNFSKSIINMQRTKRL